MHEEFHIGDPVPEEKVFEPKDYFEELKKTIATTNQDELVAQLDSINEFMLKADRIGQKNLLHKLVFTREVIAKEQVLLLNGFDRFVMMNDITKFTAEVKPKNSVKIVELERFPRAIPMNCMEDIERAKALNLFDDFCVVFTDFTDEKYETKTEAAMVARNRDPIVFGYFKKDNVGFRHERFYFITDWEDEFCDLTFTKMIKALGEMGVKNPEKKIAFDENYLNQIAQNANTEMDEISRRESRLPAMKTNQSFWERLKGVFK